MLSRHPNSMPTVAPTDAEAPLVLGLTIRRQRQRRGLTQEQLAADCQARGLKLTRGTLAKIEVGIRKVQAAELFVIARALNLTQKDFFPAGFGAVPRPRRAPTTSSATSTPPPRPPTTRS